MATNVIVTDAAKEYIQKKMTQSSGTGLRISIKKTGCSGYSYVPSIIDSVNAQDTAIVIADGVTIFLDTTWLHLLNDVAIDYVEDEKTGLKQKRLVITSQKESGRCGCGESFHIE